MSKHHSVALAIGPANYAGQAYQWAEAVSRYIEIPAESFAPGRSRTTGPFSFPIHHTVGNELFTSPWGRSRRLRKVLQDKTHLMLDGFRPVQGSLAWAACGVT